MKKAEAQLLFFKKKVEGDSIIQLKDGKILLYYFRGIYDIFIYNEKTFHKLLEIDLYKPIYEIENETKKKHNKSTNEEDKENDNEEEDDYIMLKERKEDKLNKNSIKELNNGLILIGRDNYLIELNIHEKSCNYKIIKRIEDIILDINVLSDKNLIMITQTNIIIFQNENNEFILKEKYITENDCVITYSKFYSKFSKNAPLQYFSSCELNNNNLLINSFSSVKIFSGGCLCSSSYKENFNSKIIFIDLKSLKEFQQLMNLKDM